MLFSWCFLPSFLLRTYYRQSRKIASHIAAIMYTKIIAVNDVSYSRQKTLKHQKSLLLEAPGVSGLPVLFLLVPVVHILVRIPQVPHVGGREGAKFQVIFHIIGNRPGKKVDEFFVCLLAVDAPNGCRQVADLFIPLVDQEAGCRVAGLPAVTDAYLVAVIVPSVPDPRHRPDQFSRQALRLAAPRYQ